MPETSQEIVELLEAASDALTESTPASQDAMSTAGAALEEAVAALPADLPGVGTVLSLALEVLEGAYVGNLTPEDAVAAAARAVTAVTSRLTADPEDIDGRAADVDAAGSALWTMLKRDPELSPFGDPPEGGSDASSIAPEASDRLAALIGLTPADAPELANLASWLVECAEDGSLAETVRESADHARELICSVLDETAEYPQAALNEAAEALGAMTVPHEERVASGRCAGITKDGTRCSLRPGEGRRFCHLHQDQAPSSPAAFAPPDDEDEPTCLQFVGDAALLAEFVAEALDHIQSAEAGMLAVETDPEDIEAVNAVFRAFHTIKGAAGFLGLACVQELAHKAENLLDRVRVGEIQLTGGYADLALASSDALKEMLQALDGWQEGPLPEPPPQFVELLTRLRDPEAATAEDEPITTDAIARTGDILVRQGIVDRDTVERLAALAGGRPIGEAVVEAGAASAADVAGALRTQRRAAQSVADTNVRVSTERLDSLINMVGELVIANAMLAQDAELRERSGQDVVRKIDQISKITRELQDVSMSLRMVPLSSIFQRMARLVRDLARKSGKQINLVTEGEDTEIDRNMVEAISDPLLHMVRNAVDHGIEPSEARREAGKPETGTVALRAYHAAGSVVIELEDDGKGLDRDRIYAKAVRNGVIDEGAQLSDEEVYRLIFAAGLSTAEQVTDISGRGVGMDVVRRNIEAMRGRIDIASTPGEGTVFTVRVPLTLAIIDGMLLRVGSERFILPTISILRSVRPEPGNVSTVNDRGEMIDLQDELLPVLRLHEILDVEGACSEITDGLLVVTEGNGSNAALLVDELLGQQQIVIKSLGDGLGDVPCVSGAAILGDGSVGLILDVDGLLKLARSRGVSATGETAARVA
ncbi:MAG: chemotaxis protein CheW [Armatimonadota bacterium]